MDAHPEIKAQYKFRKSRGDVAVNKKIIITITLFALVLTSVIAFAGNPMVGGSPMYPTKDIVDNAINSSDHTTLDAAVKASGLVDTPRSTAPFTILSRPTHTFPPP